MKTFSQYSLKPELQQALTDLGFTQPTEIQQRVLDVLLEAPGRDFHGQAQTGTGKTLAFGLPLIHSLDTQDKNLQGLIVAPTRELVLQICESLQALAKHSGITIESVYGGVSIVNQIRALRGGAHIIVGTPGRIIDHINRKTISLKNIRTVILDEADIMLDMGFRQEIDQIFEYVPKTRSLWLFSATVKESVHEVKKQHMKDVVTVQIQPQQATGSLTKQYFCAVSRKDRLRALARFLDVEESFYGIIFCATKLQCADIAQQLTKRGYAASALHGDMDQPLRTHVIESFKDKKNAILVATDVAARGIDVADLTHVINYSIPEDHESYVHRIGRTGRAGKQGVAITFIGRSEIGRIRTIARRFNASIDQIEIPTDDRVAASRVANLFKKSAEDKARLGACATFIKSLLQERSQEELVAGLVHVLCDDVTQDMPTEEPIRSDEGRSFEGREGRGRRREGGFRREGGREGGRRREGGFRREGREGREGGFRRREGSSEGSTGEGGFRREGREGGGRFRRDNDRGAERGGERGGRREFSRGGEGRGEFSRGGGERSFGNRDNGMQVMLTVGSDDKVTKHDIIESIQRSGVVAQDIGQIRVIARKTFVSASPDTCDSLAKALDGSTIGNRRVRAKIA